MNKPKHIPWMLLLIGGAFTVMMIWSLLLAGLRTSAVIDRDYYSHGLRYNETLLERQAAASLGWTTLTRLQDGSVIIQLRDRGNQIVPHALGQLTLLGTGERKALVFYLEEIEPGSYRAALPANLHGEQPAEIAFEREGARLTKRLLLSLP